MGRKDVLCIWQQKNNTKTKKTLPSIAKLKQILYKIESFL
jgi:hypothetical protein